MKKFKFKLESLLKVREFKEYNVKLELGRINRRIGIVKEKISQSQESIRDYIDSQNQTLKTGITSKMLQFYSDSVGALTNKINFLKKQLLLLEKEYDLKLIELTKKRGEVKVIQNLKDKSEKEYKKNYAKKMEIEIQDILKSRFLMKDNDRNDL